MKHITMLIIASSLMACATGVSTTHAYKTPAETAVFVSGSDSKYTPSKGNQGRDFCHDLEDTSRLNALDHARTGWIYGALSGLSFGTGVIMTAGTFNDSTIYKVSNTALPILGALFGIASNAAFSRAKDSGELAATAARSVNLKDEEANTQCNIALAAWNSSRSNASEALVNYLNTKGGNNLSQQGIPGASAPGAPAPGAPAPDAPAPDAPR